MKVTYCIFVYLIHYVKTVSPQYIDIWNLFVYLGPHLATEDVPVLGPDPLLEGDPDPVAVLQDEE